MFAQTDRKLNREAPHRAARGGERRGATVRVTAPNGTDFTCKIPQNAHMHRNTGEATTEKVRARALGP